MGVKGLLSFVEKNERACVEYMDLVERARQHGDFELLVDYYSFQHYFYTRYLDNVSTHYWNSNFHLPGGEYELLHRWVHKFVTDLKSLGISLVFYVDGSKGSSKKHFEAKMNTWMYRHEKSCQTMLTYVDIIMGEKRLSDIPEGEFLRPPMLEVQIFETLRESGCELHQIAFGEADYIIAQQLLMRPRAFAILSSDSDFVIFRDGVTIPLKYFDVKNDLGWNRPKDSKSQWAGVAEPEKPLRLIVGLLSTARMTRALKFSACEQLVDLSILNGNDFTGPIIRADARAFNAAFRIPKADPDRRHPSVEEYAEYVRHCPDGRLENNNAFRAYCDRNRRFAAASAHSRSFYHMLLNETEANYKPGQITHHIEQVAPLMMGMHQGIYWHRIVVEDPRYTPIEILLCDLRCCIYQVLAGRGLNLHVSEYGRSLRNNLDSATVHAVGPRLGLPCAESVVPEAVNRNLRSLHSILLMQERRHYDADLLRKYGWKNGFICVCLRFFLTLNWRQHLFIDEEEFMTVIAMSFGMLKLKLDFYYSLSIIPSLRCITMLNWFQDVYRHAYEFLARLLRVDHEMPKPREVFSAAVFFAFFMIRHDSGVPMLTVQQIERVRRDRFQMIRERKHMIRSLTIGHFEFDDQFW